MTADDLLAAIYAAPDDDDVRLVYADWLQERGDPRGELIALQIAKTRSLATQEQHRRERALLAEHAARWLAPLPIALPGVRFERGFVAACETDAGFLDNHPAWSTVRTVNSVPATDACHTASLRVVSSVGNGGIVRLAELARPLAVEELVWNGPEYWSDGRWNTADDAVRAWSEIRVLPKLRALELHGQVSWVEPDRAPQPHHVAWAWSSRYMPALAELTLPLATSRLAAFVAALAPTRLQRIEVLTAAWSVRAWRLIFERDARGRLSRLTLHAPEKPPTTVHATMVAEQLVAAVRELPRTLTVARVIVRGALWQAWASARVGLESALREHPHAAVTVDSAP